MGNRTLYALIASTAALTGCSTPSNSSLVDTKNATTSAPVPRVYRSGLQNIPEVYAPAREYDTPHSKIEIALGEDKGENRQFEFRKIVINGEPHVYAINRFREGNELEFILKPDSREKIVFAEGNPRTARSEIDELYVFAQVMNSENKPARELWYSNTDPDHNIKAIFKRPNLKKRDLNILYENNTNIIMPDLEAIRIGEKWFLAPRAEDGNDKKTSYYLVPTEDLETGAQREENSETGKVFLRTNKGIYRGTKMTVTEYEKREENAEKAERAQTPDSGIIDLIK